MSFTLRRDSTQVPVAGYDDVNDLIKVSLAGSSATKYGVVSIATTNTAQQLPNFPCHAVLLIARKANGATVYPGLDGTVTANNSVAELDQKDQVTLEVANLNQIWIYGNAGDGVSYAAL